MSQVIDASLSPIASCGAVQGHNVHAFRARNANSWAGRTQAAAVTTARPSAVPARGIITGLALVTPFWLLTAGIIWWCVR